MSTRFPEDESLQLAANPQGPQLMQDFQSIEEMAHLNRERIYTQEGALFRRMTSEARQRLFGNIARRLGTLSREIRMRAISHFFRADVNYGVGVANALGINLEKEMTQMGRDAAASAGPT